MMADNTIAAEEFKESVAEDRAAKVREAALNKLTSRDPRLAAAKQLAGDKVTKKALSKPLDKIILNVNNSIWGLTVALLPLLGLTLLMSLGLILALLLKKMFTSHLESYGVDLKVGLLALIYTWGTFFVQLLLTVVVYTIIYIIVNPADFALESLGL